MKNETPEENASPSLSLGNMGKGEEGGRARRISPKKQNFIKSKSWSSSLHKRLEAFDQQEGEQSFSKMGEKYQKKLPKGFEVGIAQNAQIFLNPAAIHAHSPQLHVSQPGQVLLTRLGVDGFLQVGRFPQNEPRLRIFRVEVGIGRECPAQRGETRDHELIEAGQRGLRIRVDDGTTGFG